MGECGGMSRVDGIYPVSPLIMERIVKIQEKKGARMKIEVGKFYKSRDGRKAFIIETASERASG